MYGTDRQAALSSYGTMLKRKDFQGYENVKKESKTMKKIWIVLIVIGLVGLIRLGEPGGS